MNLDNQKIKDKLNYIYLSFIVYILYHGYGLFNTAYSHDSISGFQNDYVLDVSLGRFIASLYIKLRGEYFPPALVGFLGFVYLNISCFLIIHLLDIKKTYSKLFTFIFWIGNSTLTLSLATYAHMYDIYCLSLLFSVLGVYYLNKKNIFIAIILFVLSIGLYQSYIQVATGLIFLMAIKDLLANKDIDTFKKIIKQFLVVGIAIIIYFVCAILISKFTGIALSSKGNSISSIQGKSIIRIVINLFKLFAAFGYYIIYPFTYHPYISGILNAILFLLCIYCFITDKSNKSKTVKTKIVLLVVLFPLAVNFIYIVTDHNFHNLMTYAFSLFYILVIIYFESLDKISIKLDKIIKIIFIILCINNFLYSNNIYSRKFIEAKKTDLVMNSIIHDIQSFDGYIEGKTPVVFIGNPMFSPLFLKPLSYYEDHRKYPPAGLYSYSSITYSYSFYINTQLGYSMIIRNASEQMNNNPIIKQMPIYPDKESIKMIDGKLYVKLSDQNLHWQSK